MISSEQFLISYQDVILYLSTKDYIFANYLVAKLPSSFTLEPQLLLFLKKQSKAKKDVLSTDKQALSIPANQEFTDALYRLAQINIDGSENVSSNFYRANKYVRILKLMNDQRYKELKKKLNEEKKKIKYVR